MGKITNTVYTGTLLSALVTGITYLAEELVHTVSFPDGDIFPMTRSVPVAVGNLHLIKTGHLDGQRRNNMT